MKIKQIKVLIESEKDFFDRVGKLVKGVDKGIRKKLTDESLSVGSFNDLAKALTPKKRELLKVIKSRKPKSIYELAKMVNRSQENVFSEVKFLEELGLIETVKETNGRERIRPFITFDKLEVEIAV